MSTVQNRPGIDSSLAHWSALENVKESISFGLSTVFSLILLLFLLMKTSPMVIHYIQVIKQ